MLSLSAPALAAVEDTGFSNVAPDANRLGGQRFSTCASQSAVESWVNGLDLPAGTGGGMKAA